jgi:hypothetical protein
LCFKNDNLGRLEARIVPYILVVVTYLGGYAAGRNVSMQEYSSAENFSYAKEKTIAMIDELLQANRQTYRTTQKVRSVACVKK